MKLAKKLKKLRSKNNLTIKEVSTRLKVTMKKVSNWENGLSIPSTKELNLLSEIYNVKSSSLFSTKFNVDTTIKEGIEFFGKPINKRKFILNVIAIFLIVISITATVISAIYMKMLSTPKDSPYYLLWINIPNFVFYEMVYYSIFVLIVAVIILIINYLIDIIKKKRIEKLKKKVGGIYDN